MGKKKKVIAFILIMTLLVIGVTACGNSTSEAKADNTSEDGTVNLRVSYWDYNLQGNLFEFAKEWGIWDEVFTDDKVKVDLIAFENGPVANESITAGELDAELSLGDQPFITGNANGVDTSVIATTMKQEESYITVVAADSDINSYKDLKGKSIGVGIGTFSHKSLLGILGENGIEENEVEFTNLGESQYTEALTAIERGELDAYFGSWYNLAAALEEGSVKQIGDSTGHPLTTYLVVTNSFIENYPDITEKLTEVLYKTIEYINENKEKAVPAIAKKLDWDEKVASEFLDKVELVADLTEEDTTSIEETQQFLINQGVLDEEVEGLIENHTDSSFIKKVRGED